MSSGSDPGTRALAASVLRLAAGGPAEGAPHLLVLDGPLQGARLPLLAEQTLGRGARSTLRLPDPGASRLHARLRQGPDGLRVEDLGSKNGVRVNGRRARGATPLRPGDLLTLGGTRLQLHPGAPQGAGAPGLAPAASGTLRKAALLAAGALLLGAAALLQAGW